MENEISGKNLKIKISEKIQKMEKNSKKIKKKKLKTPKNW